MRKGQAIKPTRKKSLKKNTLPDKNHWTHGQFYILLHFTYYLESNEQKHVNKQSMKYPNLYI